MKFKYLLGWVYEQIRDYNLFAPETDDDNNDENKLEESGTALRKQKYTTRLYVPLVIVSLYVIFYISLFQPHPREIIIQDVTRDVFHQLQHKYTETLSCPCRELKIPYSAFVSTVVTLHPICSSVFVSDEWIEAFYLANASEYYSGDFANSAYSQHKILASLCRLCNNILKQTELDLRNEDFIAIELSSEERIKSEIASVVGGFRSSATTQITSYIDYIRTVTQSNRFISRLNANMVILGEKVNSPLKDSYVFHGYWSSIGDPFSSGVMPDNFVCDKGYKPVSYDIFVYSKNISLRKSAKGFAQGCYPLEGLLANNLECFSDINCLNMLTNHFSIPEKMRTKLSQLVIPKNEENKTVYDHLRTLFINTSSTNIDYSIYFDTCAASHCAYTITKQTAFASAVTILIGLYGGLIAICRLLVPCIINVLMKCKHRSRSNGIINIVHPMTCLKNCVQRLARLNLFKTNTDRTEDNIKRELISTRVYLILFPSVFTIIILFISFNTQTVTQVVLNPTLNEYKHLKTLYANKLTCPCSSIVISYDKFIKLSKTVHSICSSDLVSEYWISVLSKIIPNSQPPKDWSSFIHIQFQLLSDLCDLANKTIENAMGSFLNQVFITSNVIHTSEFTERFNSTLTEFFHSTIIDFTQLVRTVRLVIQADQPFSPVELDIYRNTLELIANEVASEANNGSSVMIRFVPRTLSNASTDSAKCFCAADQYCHTFFPTYLDIWLYEKDFEPYSNELPGATLGCYFIDSTLFSTLDCFYLHSPCFKLIRHLLRSKYVTSSSKPWNDIPPLIYDAKFSRFPSNTPISFLVENAMIERWNSSVIYEQYFDTCAPKYCTYSIEILAKTFTEVLTVAVSMLSGISVILRYVTIYLVKFVFYIATCKLKRQRKTPSQRIRGN
ncbi:unnamed protein product [Adineta ricciae]|uniref:Uncharacterized protein n=1 Tax=Adineta ricciae TaxID=249248 RepID=A0A815NJA6_ADIRI|nr:unnamed protein product [Adineta ricciae]